MTWTLNLIGQWPRWSDLDTKSDWSVAQYKAQFVGWSCCVMSSRSSQLMSCQIIGCVDLVSAVLSVVSVMWRQQWTQLRVHIHCSHEQANEARMGYVNQYIECAYIECIVRVHCTYVRTCMYIQA